MEESEAIKLVKNGNFSGLEELVKKYYIQAVRTSYLIVQDNSQAEDIVQNAFIHANEKINQLSSGCFGPWFLRIVINSSIKVAEKQKQLISLDIDEESQSQYLMEWMLDQRPSPEEMVETEEFRQRVWKALGQLTASQRAAIVMKYYLDMSESEITQELHTPLSTIKWRLYAAREKLRGLLKPFWNTHLSSRSPETGNFPEKKEEERNYER